jgi:hydroxymethylpyrimidine/phosphomethylpyrimidine kinase
LSAAITAHLARGASIGDAIAAAKELIGEAIRNGLRIGEGIGPCDPLALASTAE